MRLAVVSDTHFGDDLCTLVRPRPGGGTPEPGPGYAALRDAVGQVDYLVLLGDIIDLSVSGYEDAYRDAKQERYLERIEAVVAGRSVPVLTRLVRRFLALRDRPWGALNPDPRGRPHRLVSDRRSIQSSRVERSAGGVIRRSRVASATRRRRVSSPRASRSPPSK
jgi:hypothetical protein